MRKLLQALCMAIEIAWVAFWTDLILEFFGVGQDLSVGIGIISGIICCVIIRKNAASIWETWKRGRGITEQQMVLLDKAFKAALFW